MSSKRRLVSRFDGDFFTGFGMQIRLIMRLLGDRRVPVWLKVLPVFSLIYLIFPLDIVIPLVDDAFILWLANTLFLELCPSDVVAEHRAILERDAQTKKDSPDGVDERDVIEANYRDKK